MPRYTTSGIPQDLASGSCLGLSAFMPHFNRLAASGAQAYKGGVTGRPGTAAIPIAGCGLPAPSPDLGDLALMGTARSSDAPNAIWPNQYYDNPAIVGSKQGNDRFYPGAGMPVQIYDPTRPQDTTMIPVPAGDLRALYQAQSARMQNPAGQAGDNSNQGSLKQATQLFRWGQRKLGPVNWTQRGGQGTAGG
jgi:hypothetical protein